MKRLLEIILVITCNFLFGCEKVGFFNVEIKNLASDSIVIDGIKDVPCGKPPYGRICTESGVGLNQNYSKSFGLSHYRWGRGYLTDRPQFQELYGVKIYYKSKSCLIFQYNIFDDMTSLYERSRSKGDILALTKNGLELMTKDQYEAAKGKYTINDKNVKCIKE